MSGVAVCTHACNSIRHAEYAVDLMLFFLGRENEMERPPDFYSGDAFRFFRDAVKVWVDVQVPQQVRFKQQLMAHRIKGDGHCLLRSLCFLLYGSQDVQFLDLRVKVAQHIRSIWNRDIKAALEICHKRTFRTADDYFAFYAFNNEYSGMIEVEACAAVLGCGITVWDGDSKTIWGLYNTTAVIQLNIVYVNDIHFEAVTARSAATNIPNSKEDATESVSLKRSAAQKTRDRKKLRESFLTRVAKNSIEGTIGTSGRFKFY